MLANPKITIIGAGSTVFTKNIVGDILKREELKGAHISLMDIDASRLSDSKIVASKLIKSLGNGASLSTHTDQRKSLENADFVVATFQIGGYEPCTVTDFDVPKKYGLRQTIADTLGVGGIMRGLRTVPHLWKICEDMTAICPNAILLQYVNPMVINMGAIFAKYPDIKAVGLCHSVQGTAHELAHDLDMPVEKIKYRAAGINHVSFFLEFEEIMEDGSTTSLYPKLLKGYKEGRFPKHVISKDKPHYERCLNMVRYEMLARTGYFVTESSEHFAEYVPWFIKRDRPDLIEKFSIPLDEYPIRCVENIETWGDQVKVFEEADEIKVQASMEYASSIIHSIWTGVPSVIYGNVPNKGLITSLPEGCVVEVPCLIDNNGIQPTHVGDLPPQLNAIMQSNLNVQLLTIAAILEENKDYIYHAAMMDPHTGAELDLEQIWSLVDDLIKEHGDWLPEWMHKPSTYSLISCIENE